MSLNNLTKGAIAHMMDESFKDPTFEPVCQILTVKKIVTQNNGPNDRYRIILSDGTHYAQSMLATQLKPYVENGEVVKNCLVKVKQYASNMVQDRRIIIVLDLEVVSEALSERLGQPENFDPRGGAQKVNKESPGPQGNGTGVHANGTAQGGSARVPARKTVGSGAGGLATGPIYPIEALSPYQNKWTIKARVTTKSEVKHWSNARGEGRLFSVNLLDESGEIKATGFNDAVDKYYNTFMENRVFYISKAKVNIAKKQFSTLNNEYEITFERDTEVVECTDSADDVPEVKLDFVDLDKLDGIEPRQTCDVIGVVDSVGELGEIISKTSQKPVSKRELSIVDDSGMSVRVTLWGKQAEAYGTPSGHAGAGIDDRPVVAFKGVSVGDFGGRSLSMMSSSSMIVNPDMPKAHSLRGWYDDEGISLSTTSQFKTYSTAGLGGSGAGAVTSDVGGNMKERKTIGQVKDEGLGMHGEKADYFNMRSTVVYIKQDNLYYTACPSEGCNKKVTMESNDSWRCEKCDRSYEAPQYRYILSANVQDHTGQIWISGFNDIGEQLLGLTAGELDQIRQENDAEYHAVLHRAANKTFMFNCRAKADSFNDQLRVRYTVTKMAPVDFSKEGDELVKAINALL